MSFVTEEYQQPQRWTHFSFFDSGGADGVISESLAITDLFKLTEIRIHCSVAFASIEDFTLRLSSVKGSAHNIMLISQAMSGIIDFLWTPDTEMHFLSDDQLVFTISLVSGVNVIGLNVHGWAAQG